MADDIQWDRPRGKRASEEQCSNALEASKEITSQGRPDLSSGVRDEFFGEVNRPPLKGATPAVSQLFRSVLACRFAGHTVKEACTMLGTTSSELNKAKRKFPTAWTEAHQEIKEAVLQNVAANVWITRSALSDLAPHAVRCLFDLITNRNTKDSIKKDAAIQVLKLLDIDGSASLGATISEAAYAFKDLADATRERFENDHIIDVIYDEEPEILE